MTSAPVPCKCGAVRLFPLTLAADLLGVRHTVELCEPSPTEDERGVMDRALRRGCELVGRGQAPIDYRDLLSRYMQRVIDCEGMDYIDSWHGGCDAPWTPAERAELNRMAKEAWAKR